MQSEFSPTITVPTHKDKRFGWRLWMLIFGAAALLLGCYLMFIVGLGGREYESHAELEFLPGKRFSAGPSVSLEEFSTTQMAAFLSQQTALKVVEDLNLTKRWGLGSDRLAAVEKLMSQTKAERIPGSSVARLTVRSNDAELAASLAQGWVDAYEQRVTAHLRSSETRAIEVLETLANDLEKKIEEKRVAWLSFSLKHSGSSTQSASEAVMPCDAESRKLELENTLIRTQLAAIQAIKAKSETSHLRAELQAVFPEDAALAPSSSQPDANLQNFLAEKLVQLTLRRNHTGELLQAYGALRREVLSERINQLAVRSEGESLQKEWDRLSSEHTELRDRIARQKIDLEVGSPVILQHGRAFPKNIPLMPKALVRDFWLGVGLILGGILLLLLAARNWPKAPRGGAPVVKQRAVEVPGQQGLAFDA